MISNATARKLGPIPTFISIHVPSIRVARTYLARLCAEIPISTNNDDAFRSPKVVTKLPLRRQKPSIFTILLRVPSHPAHFPAKNHACQRLDIAAP